MTKVEIRAVLASPFHTGAGHAGNTSLLRTQEVVLPSGRVARVPFLSANSVRHGLRSALAWLTVETLQVEPGSLSKAMVDLLWNGGAVTTTGAETDLGLHREVLDKLPWLSLMGYAAISDITAGRLRVQDMILECSENAFRLPEGQYRPAAHFRDETFGTRHDQKKSAAGQFIALADELTETNQMIYSIQCLKPGSVLHGSAALTAGATQAHQTALEAALALWAPGGEAFLGAKAAAGLGRAQVAFSPAPRQEAVEEVAAGIRDEAAAVMDLLRALTK